jgi:hypothetical protein
VKKKAGLLISIEFGIKKGIQSRDGTYVMYEGDAIAERREAFYTNVI